MNLTAIQSVLWPLSIVIELSLAAKLLKHTHSNPWFLAFIAIDSIRSLVVLIASSFWTGMLRDPVYCRLFIAGEIPSLILLTQSSIESIPKSIQSNLTFMVVFGTGLAASLKAYPSHYWPRGIEPVFVYRVFMEASICIAALVKLPELSSHSRIMALYLGCNMIAYLSLVLGHPKDTTLASVLAITTDTICYLLWLFMGELQSNRSTN